ncbi:P-loop containing nucleoside triphosphate hydrolase protein [Baffinella frigidus]|nr:P-loop containing nucleoside triphosphate hydrolase protein [Cryptophyta sp. CCMP2293]
MVAARHRLPAFTMQEELLRKLASARVLVVSGETGCGKTTQVPQFILDAADLAGQGDACSIVCTQPRRISAISVSERVASERCEPVGSTVGYQIRLESRRSDATRLLFCTTGVLLRRLVADPALKGVSHVIVDEIHERGINEDFLLIILKDLLAASPNLRLILMSATLKAEQFAAYFGGCPVAHIPGFTHPVEDVFLEDVLPKIGYRMRCDPVHVPPCVICPPSVRVNPPLKLSTLESRTPWWRPFYYISIPFFFKLTTTKSSG